MALRAEARGVSELRGNFRATQGDSAHKILPKATPPPVNLKLLGTGGPKIASKILKNEET